ncbi:hypothetical protein JCM10207_001418 [Rhodosporidiobolus poonsookiae]
MPAKRSKPAEDAQPASFTHWLIKAEPESRIEKGVDVKFSIDDLEEKKTTTWEGVRNHEAKKYLKEQMKLGQLCLFYASNCKIPGVSGIAKVCKEGYPDFNAWDTNHPYYDPKSKEEAPTWYMVDVEFVCKLPHLVPLSLLQLLSTSSLSSVPPSLSYLTPAHLSAITTSVLLTRGRLSVQPASEGFFEACREMGERGGWEEGEGREWFEGGVRAKKGGKGKVTAGAKGKGKAKAKEEEDREEAEGKEEKVEEGGRRSKRQKKA